MTPAQATDSLRRLLLDEGFNFESPDPSIGWRAFKKFAQVPLEGAEDGLLWQVGCFDFTGEELCHLDYVRQFRFSVDDEFDHLEQLHLEFTSRPCPELSGIERNRWAFDYPSLSQYFADVESFPEFHVALKHSKWLVALRHERV